jgi:hypothetical protein
VFLALVIQHAKRMRLVTLPYVTCPVLSYFSTLFHKRKSFEGGGGLNIESFDFFTISVVGRNSAVGIATRYGLDGPGIESRWGARFFRIRSDLIWGPPSLLYDGYRVTFSGIKRPARGVDHPPPV